jgi:phosphoethanolamine N-methyltransferase
MLSYWEQYEPSIESMMLSQDANELDRMEKDEILSYLPPIKGRSILELGSGIGYVKQPKFAIHSHFKNKCVVLLFRRFTEHLAENAKHLTTVDFMADYVEKNRQRHGHHAHVDFLRADVTELQFPAEKKFDVIFSNWLLMYLSDEEIKVLTRNMLSWLKDGGYLFIRESCFHPSGKF